MKPAAKEKISSLGPSPSYLQTRIRGQRLYEAAFFLAFIELSHRLHQAYRQAYDKQVVEWLLPQNTVPLSGDNLARFQSERERLSKLLKDKNSDCAKFLMSQLGLSGSRIARTVGGIRAFDATASTLSMGAAGLDIRNGLVSDFSVQDYFAQSGASAGTAVYARASQGATPRDVYFAPSGLNAPSILHESLHVFFGANLNDPDLATRIGATPEQFASEGSNVITRILREHGCR